MQTVSTSNEPILVLGGTGKTGRRIVERLRSRGLPVRVGSRAATPPFDWAREDTWDDALDGVSSIYISYAPDLAIPGAKDAIAALVWRAKLHGAKRLVLLSGRGEDAGGMLLLWSFPKTFSQASASSPTRARSIAPSTRPAVWSVWL